MYAAKHGKQYSKRSISKFEINQILHVFKVNTGEKRGGGTVGNED